MFKIVLLVFAAAAVFWYAQAANRPTRNLEQTEKAGPSPTASLSGRPQLATVEHNGEIFVYDYWRARPEEKVILIANYRQRKSWEQLNSEHGCLGGINGGFYSQEHEPLGLVVVDGKTVGKYRQNRLFNGLVGTGGNGHYAGDYKEGGFRYAVQTGPVLVREGKAVELELTKDKPARRMLAAVDRGGNLYMFYVGTDPASMDGPLLGQLPRLVKKISDQEKLDLRYAVNLDGGSASGYFRSGLGVTNWQPVGSWWCWQL